MKAGVRGGRKALIPLMPGTLPAHRLAVRCPRSPRKHRPHPGQRAEGPAAPLFDLGDSHSWPPISKSATPPGAAPVKHRETGIRIFTYPKLIFIFPTLIVSLICAVGMTVIEKRNGGKVPVPQDAAVVTTTTQPNGSSETAQSTVPMAKRDRFMTAPNLLGVLFLGIFGFNLVIMAIDFPRFSIFGLGLFILLILFILLWVGAAFEVEMLRFGARPRGPHLRLRELRLLSG